MKKIFVLLLTLFIFIPTAKGQDDLAPTAKSAILLEVSTGTIIFEKNTDEKLAPASMTKVMSMLLIMENIYKGNLSLKDMVLISKTASSMGGSQIFLEEGSNVTVEELLKGIAIASGNDAVVALAEKVAGSESAFVEMMNAKAKELGLKNTNFKNCHGLDEANHYTTAYDMAQMARELLKYPEILNYTSIYEDYFNKPDGSKTWLVNTNKLVRFYDGVDGLKTGFTKEAGYCLTATGSRNNIRFLSVVMGEETSEKRSADTVSMLSYGFNGYKINNILTKDTDLGQVRIEKGNKEFGTLSLLTDVTELLKNTDEIKKYDYEIEINKIVAPVIPGDIVGKIKFYNQNKELAHERDLTIKETIAKANYWDYLKRNLKEIWIGKAIS